MEIGLNEMTKDTCEYCNKKKKLLSDTDFGKLYDWCDCEHSKAIIKVHDKKIKKARTDSLYWSVLEKVKEVARVYNGKQVQPEIWTYNVDLLFKEFLEYDEGIFNDMKMMYGNKHSDNVDSLTNEKYYNRLTMLYHDTYI